MASKSDDHDEAFKNTQRNNYVKSSPVFLENNRISAESIGFLPSCRLSVYFFFQRIPDETLQYKCDIVARMQLLLFICVLLTALSEEKASQRWRMRPRCVTGLPHF